MLASILFVMLAVGSESRLAEIRPAPTFALVDAATGKRVDTQELRGKVALVSFIFTTCTGSCPATTARMAQVQQALRKQPNLNGRVRLISITLDPERDTPAALREYMKLHKVDPGVWSFLTGPPDEVRKAVADWGMWAKAGANGQLDHPSRMYLVDRKGTVREIYNLDLLRVTWVIEDMRLLAEER